LKVLTIQKFGGLIAGIIFILIFSVVFSQVFFKESSDDFLRGVYLKFIARDDDVKLLKQSLSISYPVSSFKMNPLDYDFYGRQIVANVFDPLIMLDKNLRPSPSLAISYGLIDDTTWNFVLRKNVYFHDGSVLNFEDVNKTFELVKQSSLLRSYLNSFDRIEKISDFEFNLYTKFPDPLLLSKLSLIYIVPSEYDAENPMIGSGPYVFDKSTEREVFLYPNKSYFCSVPAIKEFKVLFEEDVTDRVDLLTSGRVDFLAFVPQNTIPLVKQYGFNVLTLPSLEVQFLVFNMDSEIFKDIDLRKAFYSVISSDRIIEQLGVSLKSSSQFAGSGVFGFNSDLNPQKGNLTELSKIFSDKNVRSLVLKLPKSATLLGNILKLELKKVGVGLIIDSVEDEKYEMALREDPGDVYFMAFKNEIGDFSEFLDFLVRPDSKNNFSNFQDKQILDLMDKASVDLDVKSRLSILKNIMQELVLNKYFGVPLFEYEVSYAFSKDFSFEPRLDGIIYLNDIKQKR
jgi:peptide/nickel transport system substrate-binding protein